MFDKLGKRFLEKRINVGVADIKLSEPPFLLVTHLGSCIAVTVYDKETKRGGMLHALLPRKMNNSANTPAKYCDAGLEKLLEDFGIKDKFNSTRYDIKVFGGATILSVVLNDIGKENSLVIKEVLEQKKIRPNVFEVGGRKGYEVILDCETGKTYVRKFGEDFREV